MARLNYYQFVVVRHFEDKDSEILIEQGSMLAKTPTVVANKLVRRLPEEVMDDLDNIEIIVRPF